MSKEIKENWAAIELAERKVKEMTKDDEAGFNVDTFFLGGDGRRVLGLPCLYRTIIKRKTGNVFSQTYKNVLVYAKFCPFTGLPLYTDSVDSIKKS